MLSSVRLHGHFKALLILVTLCVAFVGLGWYGRKRLLENNPCEMTFGTKMKTEVMIEKYNGKYELWKVSNSNDASLGKYPLLFIPGHFGSDSQARSLASFMHNEDGLLQFYAVHFDYEAMAFHGGDILTKAAYVNTAILAIQKQYKKYRPHEEFRITLICHSYGGMIAKTSLLLSNHPACVVNNILTISAPMKRAPLSPDSSLEVLFMTVNRAWYSAHYNATKKARKISSTQAITAEYDNPECVTKARLISLTGGELDAQVGPELSSLFEISPHPRNKSFVAPSSRSFLIDKYQQYKNMGKGTMLGIQRFVTSLLFKSNNINSSISNSSTDSATLDILSDQQIISNRTMRGKFSYVTPRLWGNDILPYTEPQHLALRSMQMVGVGFPMDHYAVTWCFQFLQSVHSGLRLLLTKKNASVMEIISAFHIQNITDVTKEIEHVTEIGIDSLQSFAMREALHNQYLQAGKLDRLYILSKLMHNRFWLLAVNYFQQHLQQIWVGFVALAMLSLVGDRLGKLCGYRQSRSMPEKGVMIHFNLLWHISHRTLKSSGIHVHPETLLMALFTIILASAMYFVVDNSRHITIIVFYWIISSILAYSILLLMSFVLKTAIYMFNTAANYITKITGLSSIYKIAKKRSRRFYLKSNLAVQVACDLSSTYFYELMLLSALLLTLITTRDLVYSPKALVQPLFSVYMNNVITFALGCSLFLMITIFLFYDYDKLISGQRSAMILLVVPIILLVLPSFEFSNRFLSSAHNEMHTVSEASHIFGPEYIQLSIVIGAIFLHFSLLCNGKDDKKVKEVESMVRYTRNLFQLPLTNSDCLHEDGGQNSIYTKVYVEKDGAYHVGPSYRVVWCNCHEDRSLQSVSEWCDWCRCEKCSGKSPSYYGSKNTGMSIHTDLVLTIVLYITVGCTFYYGAEKMYLTLYCIGAMSVAILFRQIYNKDEIVIK